MLDANHAAKKHVPDVPQFLVVRQGSREHTGRARSVAVTTVVIRTILGRGGCGRSDDDILYADVNKALGCTAQYFPMTICVPCARALCCRASVL